MAISEIRQAMIDYKSNNGVSKSQLVDKMFSILNNNGNNVIDAGDKMSDSWKEIFGFSSDPNATFDKTRLTNNIDNLANYIIGSDVEISEDLPPFNKDNLKIEDGVNIGKTIYECLDGCSNDNDYADAVAQLKTINKYNVIGVIEGFKAESGKDGIMEFMDDEWDASALTHRGMVPKALLELAEEVGVTDNAHYNRIKSMVDAYAKKQGANWFESSKSFKDTSHYSVANAGSGLVAGALAGAAIGAASGGGIFSWLTAPVGAVIGGIAGVLGGFTSPWATDSSESLDRAMIGLKDLIKAKLGLTSATPTEE